MKNQRKTSKKETKPSVKVRDLKPAKDAKGGEFTMTKPIDKGTVKP